MSQNKTVATKADVEEFLAAVEPESKRQDAKRLNDLFTKVTGFAPVMWGPAIVGYGQYHYRYDSGREGEFMATGFSPRKSNLTLYIMPGYGDYGAMLERLGKHKLGKSCLYINKLADIDEAVLAEIIQSGVRDLGRKWEVKPT